MHSSEVPATGAENVMPKMRVLIAARGDRRTALAKALGVHEAHPMFEVGAADTREMLFRSLRTGNWHAVVVAWTFDGAPAEEILAAASELTVCAQTFVLDDPSRAEPLDQLAHRIATGGVRTSAVPKVGPLSTCESLDELLGGGGRRPRSGLLSCVMLSPTGNDTDWHGVLGAGGVACRWRGENVLVLRRAAGPGEAVVWAEALLDRQAGTSAGVTWFRAEELQEAKINQAEQALSIAGSRGVGLATWTSVVAAHHARRLASAIDQPEARRLRLLADLPLGSEQRRHLTTHSEEVAATALDLARLLRLGPEACEQVRLAGLLHDLGKIAIPDDLLAKPGALSPIERRVLNRHAAEGAWLCEALGIDTEVARVVRHHHTRFDALELAPDAARIVAVADALVTMTSIRPYSAARSFEHALAELRRCRGSVFDPRVVVAAHILGASSMRAAA